MKFYKSKLGTRFKALFIVTLLVFQLFFGSGYFYSFVNAAEVNYKLDDIYQKKIMKKI